MYIGVHMNIGSGSRNVLVHVTVHLMERANDDNTRSSKIF